MIPLFAVLNLVVCLIGGIVAVRALRSERLMLLPVYLLVYIVTNGLGISFAFLPQLNQLIWRSMYDTMVQPKDYVGLCLSTWIFVGASVALIRRLQNKTSPNRSAFREIPSDVALMLSLLVLAVGLGLYAKFMILGPGYSMAKQISFLHYSMEAEYQFRKELEAQIQQGQGLMMANLSSFCLFPLAWFFAVLSRNTRLAVLVIGGICFTLSLLFTFALRQKAPVLLMTLLYLLTYVYYARRSLLKAVIARFTDIRLLATGSLLFFVGLSFFYQITQGEDLQESIVHALYRVFVIPVASNQAWFVVFPDMLPFRGAIGVFDTIFWDPAKGPVGVHDVSELITGYQFSLNASFLAVAWSAAGYPGIVIICAVFCGIAYFQDLASSKLDPSLLYPVVLISLPSLLALTSTSFFDFVMKGGFLTSLAIVIAYAGFGKEARQAHKPSPAFPRSQGVNVAGATSGAVAK